MLSFVELCAPCDTRFNEVIYLALRCVLIEAQSVQRFLVVCEVSLPWQLACVSRCVNYRRTEEYVGQRSTRPSVNAVGSS